MKGSSLSMGLFYVLGLLILQGHVKILGANPMVLWVKKIYSLQHPLIRSKYLEFAVE